MLIFKHKYDLRQLQINTPIHRYLKQCLEREGHLEGYFVLIEKGDSRIHLPELKADLETLSFDGVFKASGFYHAVYLTNNSFALEFIMPDRPWLSSAIRANLEAHLSEL